jgi:DNA polymerase III sliding clamp (beta) subunit (PCNA family)
MLNRNNLSICAEFADNTQSRYAMQSIYVKPEETIGTNGHYLARVTVPQLEKSYSEELKDFAPFLLSAKLAKMIGQGLSKDEPVAICKNGAEGAFTIVKRDSTTFHAPKVEGTFPNVDAVMPKEDEKPVLEIGFNPSYLARIAKAFAQFGDKVTPCVKLTFYSKDKAAKFEMGNSAGQKMTVLLMPARLETKTEK